MQPSTKLAEVCFVYLFYALSPSPVKILNRYAQSAGWVIFLSFSGLGATWRGFEAPGVDLGAKRASKN